MDLPTFPEFHWDGYSWVTSVRLPAWAGYRNSSQSNGIANSNTTSNGIVEIVFAPEGRGSNPLSKNEIDLVKWLVDNQAIVHKAMLQKLYEAYPAIREQFLDSFDEDDAKRLLPKIRSPNRLKSLMDVPSINVHQIMESGKPFLGVALECTWDAEHGVGILLHGETPLEIGGADTAILLWLAKEYARKIRQ
ncbi:DUF6985 domain-containing protein [Planctomicrobium sp. SH668]|uniref:DUF6985 domain-containing protein n=1 Tax=Planctomicrobium sp. SH668 TaxID=3448126 RepID=UPI003F5BB789